MRNSFLIMLGFEVKGIKFSAYANLIKRLWSTK